MLRGSVGDTYITHMYVEGLVGHDGSGVMSGLAEKCGMHNISPFGVKDDFKPESMAFACGWARALTRLQGGYA